MSDKNAEKIAKPSLIARIQDLIASKGGRCAMPVYILMLLGFIAPLAMVAGFSVAEPKSFTAFTSFSLANFAALFEGSVWKSFAWSIGLAAFTTAILVPICYPVAVGMVRVFGRMGSLAVSVLSVFPMFVSENVRLYGWILFFTKKGILDGTLALLNGQGPDVLYTPGMTAFGMVYTYLPYMLFPIVLDHGRARFGRQPFSHLARDRAAFGHAGRAHRHAADVRALGRRRG